MNGWGGPSSILGVALLRSSGGALSGVMPRERALMAVVGMVEPVCRRSLRVELGGLRILLG